MKANGTFTVKKWDERSDQEISSDTKTIKVSVEYVSREKPKDWNL